MHLPVIRTGLVGLSALFALVAALAVFIYSSGDNTAEAATYTPTSTVNWCNSLPYNFPSSKVSDDLELIPPGSTSGNNPEPGNCLEAENLTPGANPNFSVRFTVPGGQSNFGSSVITNVPGTVTAVNEGAKVGGLRSDVTLALLNGACNQALRAEFTLYSSEVGTGDVAVVNPEGTGARWEDVNAPDEIVADDGAGGETANDEIADNASAFVTKNLPFYIKLLTPRNGSYLTPLARYTGASRVPLGGEMQLLSFFQFNAASLSAFSTNGDELPHIFGRVSHSPSDGILSLSILNDPTAVKISINPIHDFCTPLVVKTMLLGVTPAADGSQVRYANPSAGTYAITNFSYGARDEDNDGLENGFDTCAFVANTGMDSNGNGIDNACDTSGSGVDVDGDGFWSRQDNCPQIANGTPQLESETDDVGTVLGGTTGDAGNGYTTYTNSAPDGGPISDGIGDACDPNIWTANNEGAVVEAFNLVPRCFGDTDADGDGYCVSQDQDDGNAAIAGYFLNKGMDMEFANPKEGDGFGANTETYVGTDPLDLCGPGTWPADLHPAGGGNNTINIQDVNIIKPVFSTTVTVGGPTFKFYDIFPSGTINIQDVNALKPVFSQTCTP
jgi:hypothetical protein